MVRTFILKASEAHTSSDFRIRDLPSSSGRLDVVCRCVIAALLYNSRVRTDTVFLVVMEGKPNPPLCMRFDGREIKTLPFSEIGLAVELKRVLGEHYESNKKYEDPHWAGVSVERKSFAELLHLNFTRGGIYYLHENGKDIRTVSFDLQHDILFVLGDQKGLTSEDEEMVDELQVERINVGPLSYLSSQVIAIVHDELDRRRL